MCSALVPMLFTENFDYQTRDDFVKGILDNMEVNLSIMLLIITATLFLYACIFRDVI